MSESDKTNILFIFTDQHRLSGVGCYGPTPCRTPNIDRLAAEGVRFETAYTTCPVCSPARASVMTGCDTHGHGVMANTHEVGCRIHELTDGPDLLPRRLESAGYRNGYTGKWHLGGCRSDKFLNRPITTSLPKDVGFEGQNFPNHGDGGYMFEEYQNYLKERGLPYKKLLNEMKGTPGRGRYNILDTPVEGTVAYFLAEHTIAMIDRFREGKEPFFIWHNFWGPHEPYYVPQKYYDMYRDVEILEWPNFRWDKCDPNLPYQAKLHPYHDRIGWEEWAETIRHYYAFATLIDEQVGRIMDHLRKTGLLEKTLVVFSSDHGETLGSHGGMTDKGFNHFEEIQRIPFIARVPQSMGGNLPAAGTVMQEWVSLADVYPTFCDVAGASLDRPDAPAICRVHGRSLLPLLKGEKVEDWRDEIFVQFHGVNALAINMITCRAGDLKYGWNATNKDELYDLAKDPYETTNLIDDPAYAGKLEEMHKRMYNYMERVGYEARGRFKRDVLRIMEN
ncbi:MAG: sulfatase-like hydrolase/transferase [Planctomycetes bacterium]|nr:sulfatase-like hydrolase/transferase [Planctomycetota bacterium]